MSDLSGTRRISQPTVLVCGAACAAAAMWAIIEHATVPLLPYDDAFITYRYVENMAAGAGLTYNPPERAWGFTSPLYLFWLASLRLVLPGVDLPSLAVRGNAVFALAAGVATLLLVRRYTTNVALATVAACVLMVHPSLLSISTGGMEAGLFLALLLFALFALASDKPGTAGLLIGLSFLARPEAVTLLPVAAVRYWRAPRRLGMLLLCAAAVAGAWLTFTAIYYESIVPLSVIAKSRPLYPLEPGHALRTIAGYLGPALFGPLAGPSSGRNLVAALVIVAATAASLLSPRLRAQGAWMPGVVGMLLIALYDYGNPMFFEWYWPAVLGTVLIVVMVGAAAMPPVCRWIGPIWIAVMTLVAYGDNAGGHSKSIRFVDQDGTRLRVLTYERIGKYLTALTGGHASVAAAEVGALGYYYTGPMIDACGLVSPEAIRFLPVPADQRAGPAVGAISTDLIQSAFPDWVVTMPIFAQKSLLGSDWFEEHYELASTVALPKIVFDSVNVLVFKKRAKVD